MDDTPFIVAEISKTWIDSRSPDQELVAQKFARVIEHNRKRGYRLHSFQLHQLMVSLNQMNETIVAVFERSGLGQDWVSKVTNAPDDEPSL